MDRGPLAAPRTTRFGEDHHCGVADLETGVKQILRGTTVGIGMRA